jgi:hypothetical protein
VLLICNETADGEDTELQIGYGRTEPGGPTLPMLGRWLNRRSETWGS